MEDLFTRRKEEGRGRKEEGRGGRRKGREEEGEGGGRKGRRQLVPSVTPLCNGWARGRKYTEISVS